MCSGVSWNLNEVKSPSKDSEICSHGLMPPNRLASTSCLDPVSIVLDLECISSLHRVWLFSSIGPYINAETTAGGFPGWGTYTSGKWRTSDTDYFEAWQDYIEAVGHIIAENQITNGGPVILVQVLLSSLSEITLADMIPNSQRTNIRDSLMGRITCMNLNFWLLWCALIPYVCNCVTKVWCIIAQRWNHSTYYI